MRPSNVSRPEIYVARLGIFVSGPETSCVDFCMVRDEPHFFLFFFLVLSFLFRIFAVERTKNETDETETDFAFERIIHLIIYNGVCWALHFLHRGEGL